MYDFPPNTAGLGHLSIRQSVHQSIYLYILYIYSLWTTESSGSGLPHWAGWSEASSEGCKQNHQHWWHKKKRGFYLYWPFPNDKYWRIHKWQRSRDQVLSVKIELRFSNSCKYFKPEICVCFFPCIFISTERRKCRCNLCKHLILRNAW